MATPDQNQIEGLPAGAIVGAPLQQSTPPSAPQAPAQPAQSQQIEGLPAGAIVGPSLQTQAVGDVAGDPTHILQDGKIVPILKQAFSSNNTVGGIIKSQDAGAATGTQYEGYAKIGGAVEDAIKNRYEAAKASIAQHVMQGSPIEKVIQKINPEFKASGPAYTFKHVLTSNLPFNSAPPAPGDPAKPDVLSAPIVDVAQNIDKKKHPILKAVTEQAQSFTSPENVGILAATGGFGMIESPEALGVANRLLSAGFSAQAIGSVYQNSKSFKDAYDKGDTSEAVYQMTHMVLSGAAAAMSGQHAAGAEPVASTVIGAKAGDALSSVPGKVSDVVSDAASNAAGHIKEAVIGPDAEQSAIRAIKPTAKGVEKFSNDFEKATADIKAFDESSPIKTVGDLKEAIPQIKEKIWDEEIAPAVARHATETVDMSSVKQAVLDSLTPEMREFEPEGVVKDVEKFADTAGKARTVAQADGVLKYINSKLDSYFAKNPAARSSNLLTNPDTAMWETARRGIREQFLQTLEDAGESGIREARQRYGALSGIESAVDSAAGRLAKNPAASIWHVGVHKVLGAMLGTGLGVAHGGPIGAAVGLGAVAADALQKYRANPDVLIRRAIKRGGSIPEDATHVLDGGTIKPLVQ
jgi:hypothetical protein